MFVDLNIIKIFMNISGKVAHNTIIQIISKIISIILGIIVVAIMTRHLGKEGFGEYTTIITFLSFFAILADFGITLVTAQMISESNAKENKILNNLFALRLISAIIFLGIAPVAVIFFPYSYDVKIGVAITSVAFLFIALNQVLVGLFQKKLSMGIVAIAEVVSKIVLIIVVIIAVKFNFNLIGILIATVLANAVSFLIHFIFSRKFAIIKMQFDFEVWKEILKRSWPLAITIALNLVYLKADILILSLVKSQSDVGIYGVAYKMIDVLITIPFMFAGIILPIITVNWVKQNKKYFEKIMQRSFDLMVILLAPIIIGTQFVANQIIEIIAGKEFENSGGILKILSIAAGMIFLGCIFSHAIVAVNKQKKIIKAYIFTSVTALAGYLIFIPKFSYIGAAWVTVYSEIVIALMSIYYVWKFTKFFPNIKIALKSFLASFVMGCVLYVLPNWFYQPNVKIFITIFIACLTYFACLYFLKAITKKDLSLLIN